MILENLQPYGFDVGASKIGMVLKGLDYGVEGMRVGGQVCSEYLCMNILVGYDYMHARFHLISPYTGNLICCVFTSFRL